MRKSAPPGEVRIIGGLWKRTKLPVPLFPGLRPTPDRVRETLFNWLGQDLSGWHCVDAFAGTGALGWEAASRGATQVVMIENNAALVEQLQATRNQLQVEGVTVVRGDGLAWMKRQSAGAADLVLLDPPFDAPVFDAALDAARRLVRDNGYVYLEAPKLWDAAALAAHGLVVYRHLKAGAVHAHLLQVMENAP